MVGSLPGNPRKNSVIVPIMVGRLVADILKDQYVLSLNTTGLKKDYGGNIVDEVKHWQINVDKILEDVALAPVLVNYIDSSLQLEAKQEKMLVCECKKLEIPLAEVKLDRHKERKVEKDGKCIFCNTGSTVTATNLYMRYPEKESLEIVIYPRKLQENFNELVKGLYNSTKRISKIRETGTKFTFNGTIFNLDPDFTSLLYFKYLRENNLHTLIHSHRYIAHLARLPFMGTGTLDVLVIPYLDKFADHYDDIKQKVTAKEELLLVIASNFSWKKIDTNFDPTVLKAWAKIDTSRKFALYEKLKHISTFEELIENFNNNILSKA